MRSDGAPYAEAAQIAGRMSRAWLVARGYVPAGFVEQPFTLSESEVDALNLVPDDLRGLDRNEARKRVVDQITAEGLAPRRFGDKVRSEQAAHFQRDKGLITYSANTPDTPLLAGTQDRLSVFIQISGMLLAEPQRWGPGAVMNFNTTGARDSEPWAFQVAGMEQLKMPYGTLEALRLVRQEQKQYDQRVELWMAPSLEHLPVRIRITQTSGDQVDLLLRSKEPPSTNP
jgi:predicted DNA-binding protein (UPF0251 family)